MIIKILQTYYKLKLSVSIQKHNETIIMIYPLIISSKQIRSISHFFQQIWQNYKYRVKIWPVLGFFNNEGEFIVEPGDFKVFVGGSSVTTLETNFKL